MPSTSFCAALLTSGFAVRTALAYTQVNVPSPFMNKNIDPIVFPGSYSSSHLHSFYGSDGVTASTTKSRQIKKDTCTNAENPNDLSVYWTPTLLYQSGDDWEPVPVMRFSAYYGLGDEPAEIPIPRNLMMLAGNSKATTPDEMVPEAHAEWFCEGDEDAGSDANGFPSQTCSTHMQQLLYFPNCVNTETLETAYKDGEPGSYHDCPAGMQAMPQLRFSIRYDLREVVSGGWSGTAPVKLASGNAYSSHGDFINGWTKEGNANLVLAMQSKDSYISVNGDRGNDGDTMDCEAVDAEPDMGTSDYAESVSMMSKRSVPALGWSSKSRFARKA
ncbi:uncharacterized protein LTR77_010137 [Saxophila tyrrhenica]|uniref:DUF1996 domain-containing protein n=1 Tax=Saxophila tyrrhenica TaxID=1690608 RepID=A0AAV9NW94_9PEZI|nr:hypothetical protein LTR77_010137 [Saxophila tyrrhenica]